MTMETIGNTRLIVLQLQHVVHHAEETVKSGQQLWMT
jgi:hypothetical protein